MKRSLAIVVCAVALAMVMFAPSKASAGGRYYGSGYGYVYCCPTCGYVRGRGFNRPYNYGRSYGYGRAYPRYGYGRGYGRYGYGRGNPRARSYARRSARRNW